MESSKGGICVNLETKKEFSDRIQTLRQQLKDIESIKTGCQTCKNYKREICGIAGIAPPPEVVVSGCDAWRWDGVPF